MSEVVERLHRRGLVDYHRFARELHSLDDCLAVRVLRETVIDARSLTGQEEIDAFHAEPPTTRSRGWDSLLAPVACITGVTASPGVLTWTDDPSRLCVELFDPLERCDR